MRHIEREELVDKIADSLTDQMDMQSLQEFFYSHQQVYFDGEDDDTILSTAVDLGLITPGDADRISSNGWYIASTGKYEPSY